jgi:hypothetical protein
MTNKLDEYKNKPVLSERAKTFIYNYDNSNPMPDDIRVELEKFAKLNQPFANACKQNLENQLKRILNK